MFLRDWIDIKVMYQKDYTMLISIESSHGKGTK